VVLRVKLRNITGTLAIPKRLGYLDDMTTNTTEQVKIGKTVYAITEARPYEMGGTVWDIRKGNTTKVLIYSEGLDSYTLWSARNGMANNCRNSMPKLVKAEFIR
jgi:starvation-inducible outer membrane lipoprotein